MTGSVDTPVQQNFSISKGRTGTFTVPVTGVASWTALFAKLFATDAIGNSALVTLTGAIDGPNNKIVFNYLNSDTVNLTQSSLYYEIVIYKADKSYMKACTYGLLNIAPVVKVDPTT
jgi:hypothetical protein